MILHFWCYLTQIVLEKWLLTEFFCCFDDSFVSRFVLFLFVDLTRNISSWNWLLCCASCHEADNAFEGGRQLWPVDGTTECVWRRACGSGSLCGCWPAVPLQWTFSLADTDCRCCSFNCRRLCCVWWVMCVTIQMPLLRLCETLPLHCSFFSVHYNNCM